MKEFFIRFVKVAVIVIAYGIVCGIADYFMGFGG